MASKLLFKVGKSLKPVQNGTFCFLRTCYQESNRSTSSSGQTSSQSDGATYGAPEYFQYDENSFYDIHCDTDKYRLPRPSSKTKPKDKK